jgi:hypothetical protein
MTKPYILNRHERAALLALSQHDQVSARSVDYHDFSRAHLEALLRLGLATRQPSNTEDRRAVFKISDSGWRCMYSLTKAQIDSQADRKPIPFRICQWPPPAELKKAA